MQTQFVWSSFSKILWWHFLYNLTIIVTIKHSNSEEIGKYVPVFHRIHNFLWVIILCRISFRTCILYMCSTHSKTQFITVQSITSNSRPIVRTRSTNVWGPAKNHNGPQREAQDRANMFVQRRVYRYTKKIYLQ